MKERDGHEVEEVRFPEPIPDLGRSYIGALSARAEAHSQRA